MYSCYKKGEDCIKVRKITTDFFKKQLNKSKDYLTGVPYEEITTHTCITETKESKQ
jgi:hypothetical protein